MIKGKKSEDKKIDLVTILAPSSLNHPMYEQHKGTIAQSLQAQPQADMHSHC